MMELTLFMLFLFLPSVTILACRPKFWPYLFVFCLVPPLTMFLLFVIHIMTILHGLIL